MEANKAIELLLRELFDANKVIKFENKLTINNSKMRTFKGFISISIIEGTALMICAMMIYWQFIGQKIEFLIITGIFGFFAPFLFNYIFQDLVFERRKQKKEEMLSDLLLEASVFCDESSMAKTIAIISQHEFELIDSDFKRAHKEITNGASVEEALNRIKFLNDSKAYSRAIDLFIHGYKTGAKISNMLKESAEDLLETKAIIKERQATMLITKYTLLLSAGLIVPAVLGAIIGLVGGFNGSGLAGIELGLNKEQRAALFDSAILSTAIYIFEYSALSSFFLALQEGNKKNFWIYSLILIPAAMAVFTLSQTFAH